MRTKFERFVFPLILVVLLLNFGIAVGSDVRNTPMVYGLKAGLVSPGTWYAGDFSYDPDMGYSLGGFLDYKLGDKITGGLYVDVDGINVYETSSTLYDIGITIKAILYSQTSTFTFKPGIGIGYGALGKVDYYASTNYMMLRGFVDVVYSTSSSISWLGEIGLWGSPNGGNDDFEAYFDTGFMVRGGIVF